MGLFFFSKQHRNNYLQQLRPRGKRGEREEGKGEEREKRKKENKKGLDSAVGGGGAEMVVSLEKGKKGVREEGEAEEGDDGGVEMSVIGCDDIFSRYEKLN